jgi:hypothetical protein
MKNIFIGIMITSLFLFTNSAACFSQTNNTINQWGKDAQGNDILIGKCTPAALEESPFAEWYHNAYASYIVDSFTCKFIKPLLAGKSITIFLGTWCGDSRREVPRILKMLECCEFPQNSLTMIMVSNKPGEYKKSPGQEETGRNIVRVPTVIIEENGIEIGRIIEFPKISLEKDLLAILKKENYVPNYHEARIIAK